MIQLFFDHIQNLGSCTAQPRQCSNKIYLSGSVQMLQLAGTMGKMKKLYEEAGKTASESIENMRTVASLNLEKVFIEKYRNSLAFPTR